jgi:uncharacterized protein (TIGR03086 family)
VAGHRYALLVSGAPASATAATRDLDHVRPDPLAAFHRWQDPLRAQLMDLTPTGWGRLVDHPVGQRSVQVLVQMRTLDLLLHAWDLARSLDVDVEIAEDLAAGVLEEAGGVIGELRNKGLYAETVTAATSSPTDRLLAFSGRGRAVDQPG